VFRAPVPAADAAARPLARLGVALEYRAALPDWVRAEQLDALFLHRPWRLSGGALPGEVGVLYAHLPFDDRLTTSDNAPLAAALGFRSREVLGVRDGRRIGMIGDVAPASAAEWLARVRAEFGGVEAVALADPDRPVSRVAVVGAMNERLVREAAARGAGCYVTGQMREPARAAVAETGIAVAAVGHERAERWGLAALAQLVRARWPGLAVSVERA
jgi:putative NIF3 family GTP cyclohydrolase 1 type 2